MGARRCVHLEVSTVRLRRRRHDTETLEDAGTFEVIDLPARHEASYLVCLEPWSDEMREAGDHKSRWYERAKGHGLRVKLAVNAADQPIGMIQYVPIDQSPAEGTDLYMILCIWVHGYRSGVGNEQGRGIGTALLAAAEADARALGAMGIAAWGLTIPVWMKSAWFKKLGYQSVQRAKGRELVWKPFAPHAEPPRWVNPRPVASGGDDHVHVVAFQSGWCPAANLVYERAKRAANELGDGVHFTTIDTMDRETFVRFGHSDEVFVDGRPLQRGAPPSYRAVKRRLGRKRRKHHSP